MAATRLTCMHRQSPRSICLRWMTASIVTLHGIFAGTAALAGCPSREEVMAVVSAYVNKTPMEQLERVRNMDDAYCAQGMIAAEIGRSMGVMVGYGAAFTSQSVRDHYHIEVPHRAFLYEKMFLKNGTTIMDKYGARPSVTADLILVIKDYDIQNSRTLLEALSHISHVVPYIELSDLMLGEEQPVTPLHLVATNMGTRMGVLGTPIPVKPTQEFLDGLASMVVIMRDQDGNELGRARGNQILGNPIAALQWLAQDLERNAQRIQVNDRISVGAFFPGRTPTPGLVVTVDYEGLPGNPSVAVTFR